MARSQRGNDETRQQASIIFDVIQPAALKLEQYNPTKDGDYDKYVISIVEEAFELSGKEKFSANSKVKERSEVTITCYLVQKAMNQPPETAQDYDRLLDSIFYKLAQVAQIRNWSLAFTQKAFEKSFGLDFIQYVSALRN